MAKNVKQAFDDVKSFVEMADSVRVMADAFDKIDKLEDFLSGLNRKISAAKHEISKELVSLEEAKKSTLESKAQKKELDTVAAVIIKEANLKKDEIVSAAIAERATVMAESESLKTALANEIVSKKKDLKGLQELVSAKKEELGAFQKKIDSSKEALRSLIE